ncbi:MAG: alpha/beta fold hydrolase [Burkholderiales bacterium]
MLWTLAPQVGAAPLPAADFFKPDVYADFAVSPSGKRIAATVTRPDGRLGLAVLNLEDLSKSKVVASYEDADIWGAKWVNDDRLLYRLYDKEAALFSQRGIGLFAVDANGGSLPRRLVRLGWEGVRTAVELGDRSLDPTHRFFSRVYDGSNDVIVVGRVYSLAGEFVESKLKRVDTVTGVVRTITQDAPDGVIRWAVDPAGRPRVAVAHQEAKERIFWKPTPDAAWIKIDEHDLFAESVFDPVYVDNANRLFATARAANEDTESFVVIDMGAGLGSLRPLVSAKGYDIDGMPDVGRSGAVLGVHYLTDASATVWFDAGLKKIQEQVDAKLPGTVNQLDCGGCEWRQKILVKSTADRVPAVFYLYDTVSGALEPVAKSRPWIDPATMATRDMVRVATRDGLSMPVHITRPVGLKGPQPTVVLVHGGPWVRGGKWEWDADSQFLASRGYVVIEPEFRGSLGFGYKHFRSSWKQWGLAMQDDVADATKWAIQQGYTDPKRVCIAGASYGGYATLMGLIRNPELFRCGVEWAGVTDIDLKYSITWSDASERWKQYGMPAMVGDRKLDAAQLAATSPLKLADKVTQPLLMAYGGIDERVPLDHGTQFRDAVRKTNSQVEWIVYPAEGHGWMLLANNVDFWTRVERFLDKNLKNPVP